MSGKTQGPVQPGHDVAATGAQSEMTTNPIDAARFQRGIEILAGCLYSIRRVHRTDGDVDALVTHVENTLDWIEESEDVDAVVSAVMGPAWRATLTAEYDGWDDEEEDDPVDAAEKALLMERVRAAPAFHLVARYEQTASCPECDDENNNTFVRVDGVRRCRCCGFAIDEPYEDGAYAEKRWTDVFDGAVGEFEDPVDTSDEEGA